MDDIKISVIIPVYNVEKYLAECLDSVINQTFKKIEVICLDDGSTDNSLNILEEYSKKDDRIKISSHSNIGLGATRNRGMDYITGEYVYFLDSDDFIDLNAFEELYGCAKEKNLDLVMFQGINYDDELKEYYEDGYLNMDSLIDNEVFTYRDIEDLMFSLSVNVGNKLFRRQFLLDINAQFSEGLTFEDTPIYYKVILSAKRMLFIKKHYYKRRRRKDSITASNNNKFFDIIQITDDVFDIFKESNHFDEFKRQLYNYKIQNIFIWFDRIAEEYKNEFFIKIKEHFKLIKDDTALYNEYLEHLNSINKSLFENILISETLNEFNLLMRENKLKQIINNKDKKIKKLQKQNKSLKSEIKNLRKFKKNVVNSKSWKLTKPFRKFSKLQKFINLGKINICTVDTIYSLFIFLLIKGYSKDDLFIFSNGIPKSIRTNISHIYYKRVDLARKPDQSKFERFRLKRLYDYGILKLRLLIFIKTFGKKVDAYGHGHLAISFPLYEYKNSYLIEDGVGNYLPNLKETKYGHTLSEKIQQFIDGRYLKGYYEGFGTHPNIKKIYLTKDNAPEIIQNKVETINMEELWNSKTDSEKEEILRIFNLDYNSVINMDNDVVLLLTEPFCEEKLLPYNEEIKIYNEIINEFKDKRIIIKPHPRESKNYSKIFPGIEILEGSFPIEILNLIGFKPKIVASIISTALLNFKDSEIYIYEGVLSSKRLNESRKNLKEMLKN